MRVIDLPINHLTPNGRAFNCSIIEAYGATRLFYRAENWKDYNTQIYTIDLDKNFEPIERSNKRVDLVRFSSKVTTFDDPRAFFYKGELYIIYANGMLAHRNGHQIWGSGVVLANMKNMVVGKQRVPKFGNNDNMATGHKQLMATEKNWSPFEHNGRFLMVYTINPLVIVDWDLQKDVCTKISETKFNQTFWKHGEFLGGGTPLKQRGKDEFYGFFHTFTDDHSGKATCRRYHFGFYSIKVDEHGMWKVTHMSRKPLMSAERDEARDLRPKNSPWLPNCIYPCGFIERDGKVIISAGWQDCRCQLIEFTWDEIMKDVRPVK